MAEKHLNTLPDEPEGEPQAGGTAAVVLGAAAGTLAGSFLGPLGAVVGAVAGGALATVAGGGPGLGDDDDAAVGLAEVVEPNAAENLTSFADDAGPTPAANPDDTSVSAAREAPHVPIRRVGAGAPAVDPNLTDAEYANAAVDTLDVGDLTLGDPDDDLRARQSD